MEIYVDKDATGNNDGTSLEDAFTTIQAAIDSIPYNILHSVSIQIVPGDYTSEGPIYFIKNVDPGMAWIEVVPYEFGYFAESACGANTTAGRIVTDNTAGAHIGDVIYAHVKDANGVISSCSASTITDIEPDTYIDIADTGVTPTTGWSASSPNVNILSLITNVTATEFYGIHATNNIIVYCPNMTYFYTTHCDDLIVPSGGFDFEFTDGVIDGVYIYGCSYSSIDNMIFSKGQLYNSYVDLKEVYQSYVATPLYIDSNTVCVGDSCNLTSVTVSMSSEFDLINGRILNGGPNTITYSDTRYPRDLNSGDSLIIYVDPAATGKGDGTSWTDAFTTIQAAVDSVPKIISDGSVDIRLKRGSYSGNVVISKIASPAGGCEIGITGEYYLADCDTNAVAGRIVPDGDMPESMEVGDTIVAWSYDDGEMFEATVTDIESTYIQTDESTLVPTTGWQCLSSGTVISGMIEVDTDVFAILGVLVDGGAITSYKGDGFSFKQSIIDGGYVGIANGQAPEISYVSLINGGTCKIEGCTYAETYAMVILPGSALVLKGSNIEISNTLGESSLSAVIYISDPCELDVSGLKLSGDVGIQANARCEIYGVDYANTCTTKIADGTTPDIIYTSRTPAVSTGTAAPTSTPIQVGDIYVDTTNKKMYIATGTSSSSDWTITN